MQGMGPTLGTTDGKGGADARAIALALAVLGCALVAIVPPAAVDAADVDLPDLVIIGFYNVSTPIVGQEAIFNITIMNSGTEAYLLRTNGTLEVYLYKDNETVAATVATVYEDIYMGENASIDVRVTYGAVGRHRLRAVLDERGVVAESNETNNEATVEFDVVEAPVNRPPTADGGNDRTGYIGDSLLFSGEWSSDPDNDTLSYTWDFGDAQLATGKAVHHTYLAVGTFRASLTVSDGQYTASDNFTVTIVLAPVNHPPDAEIYASRVQVAEGATLALDGLNSSDPDLEDTLVYDWDFDASDGVKQWVRGPTVQASWSKAGNYTVTLRVSDGRLNDTATVVVRVTAPPPPNQLPTADAGPHLAAIEGESITVLGTGVDPDGTIRSYEWDTNEDGIYDTYSDTSGRLVWRFDAAGEHTLRLRVTDDRGGTATASAVVSVAASPPEGRTGPGVGTLVAAIAVSIAVAAALFGFGYWRTSRQ